MITVLGPTAIGKTAFAAQLAHRIGGEVISADSRQVYRGMDIGTGKDYEDYIVEGEVVPYHLVDIVEPGYEYNVYEFQHDFLKVYEDIVSRDKIPVMCGGTGMYLEAVLNGYKLLKVPDNRKLRNRLESKTMEELKGLFESFKSPHNLTDITDRKRLLRAIEIADYYQEHEASVQGFPKISSITFGIHFDRSLIRERITARLKKRMGEGMTSEIKDLLKKGITPGQLKFYGLEYNFLTQYELGEISKEEMFRLLNTAIHQFAKRQMTWFRRMEKRGHQIHWIDGRLPLEEKIEVALRIAQNEQ
ncbi:MAG: tRNA (adenosine(37)-N6)-dimethylallyltransferase MiaA [Chlorobi bacterium]|nr:tRNA (adenosine(37)-N6)-dimethylallyltransferase MiaA [Chlorobiota bacterium]